VQAEAERLVYEDPHPELGFMLHPDLKWDQVGLACWWCRCPAMPLAHSMLFAHATGMLLS
jgi:hypothetical protein